MCYGLFTVLVLTFDKGDHWGSETGHAVEVTVVTLLAKARASIEALKPYHVPDCTGSIPLVSKSACFESSYPLNRGLRVMCDGFVHSKLDTSQRDYQLVDVEARLTS